MKEYQPKTQEDIQDAIKEIFSLCSKHHFKEKWITTWVMIRMSEGKRKQINDEMSMRIKMYKSIMVKSLLKSPVIEMVLLNRRLYLRDKVISVV
jgi:uncharacterized protein (UPF0335 family)